jgi:hypothetical protein
MKEYKVASSGMDNMLELAYEVAEACREGYIHVVYTGEDTRPLEDEEEESTGVYYAIMSADPTPIPYEKAMEILNHYHPLLG